MKPEPSEEMIAEWHRWFAVACNNRGWDLTAKSQRAPEQDREMLLTAYAAAYHWSQIGTPLHEARSDVMLAHVHSLLGQSAQALVYARRALTYFESGEGEDWDLAFAHAEMAFAGSAAGDRELHARHYASAQEMAARITEAEDRQIFMEEFARIPRPVG